MENSISYLSALGLINCDYHLPAMENPVTSKLARNLVNDCHFGLIALDNPEAPRLNVEENGCINLSAYIDDIKIKKIKYSCVVSAHPKAPCTSLKNRNLKSVLA